MKRLIWIGGLLLVVMAAAGGAYWKWMRPAKPDAAAEQADGPVVPTTRVVRGTIALDVNVNGELRAGKSVVLSAPSVGGTLRILSILATGTPVKAGDVLVELDPSDQEYAVEQAKSQLEEAEQTIAKRKADMQVQAAEQEVALLTARFDVRRAELDAKTDKDLIPANEYARRQLALDQAKQQLARLESDAKTRVETDRAALALVEEGRAKATLAMQRAKQNIESLVIRAPIDGMVVVRQNMDTAGGMYYGGMTLPEIRAGDNTFAGRQLLDVYDLTGMQLRVRINELARANVAVGQTADVISDAVPGVIFKAKVSTVAGNVATSGYYDSSGPSRQFDASLTLVDVDPRLRPGTTVRVVLRGKNIDGVLQVPLQAVRQKNGKPIVFLRTPKGFETREVKVMYRTESRAGLDGIDDGAVVALVDPTVAPSATAQPTATGNVK